MIVQLLTNICTQLQGGAGIPFGHGPRSYANLQDEDTNWPAAWLYPFVVITKTTASGALYDSYQLLMDFQTKCSLDDSKEQLEKALKDMESLSTTFLQQLVNTTQVQQVTNIRREPLYHVLDVNLVGYALSCTVELKYSGGPIC